MPANYSASLVSPSKLNVYSKKQFNSVSYFNTTLKNDVLNDQLVKFWQIEEVDFKPALSKAEQYCENHFLNNFTRNDKGQFVVSIPFKNNVSDLGHSKDLTMQRFLSQERRLMKNPNLYEDYKKFMNEYEQLGFELRKWLTNKRDLCDKFYINENLSSKIVQLGENEANKTLGILWNANQDNIQYTDRIFDPLGLLGPIIIIAKMIITEIVARKISWDEAIPQNLQTIWSDSENSCKLNISSTLEFLTRLGFVINYGRDGPLAWGASLKQHILPSKCYANTLENCETLLRIDNTTEISYVNRMGSIQFPILNGLAKELWRWCESKRLWVYAPYISSSNNVQADEESRTLETETEWELSKQAFQKIQNELGVPETLLLCISPFSLLPRVLQKIVRDKAQGI
ncbi:hypothetical protein NQ318_010224, partial [Aromia moschata]